MKIIVWSELNVRDVAKQIALNTCNTQMKKQKCKGKECFGCRKIIVEIKEANER